MKRMLSCALVALSLAVFGSSLGQVPDMSSWKRLDEGTGVSGNMLLNPSFDEGGSAKHWILGKEARVSVRHGRNQWGLGMERRDVSQYSVNVQSMRLKPSTQYVAGGWIRNEGFDPSAKNCWLGTFGIEFYDGKKHIMSYYAKSSGNSDWTLYTIPFTTSPNPKVSYTMVLFMGKGRTGTVSYDDLFVREVKAQWLPSLLQPSSMTLDASHARLELGSAILGTFGYRCDVPARLHVLGTLRSEDGLFRRQVWAPVVRDRIVLDFTCIPCGLYALDLDLADSANRTVLARRTDIKLQALSPARCKGRKVYVDDYSRLVVDGKPVLPIGLYTGSVNAEDVSLWREGGFDFVMPYGGPALCWPGESVRHHDSENLKRALSHLQSGGIGFGCNLLTSFARSSYRWKSWWDGKDRGLNPKVDMVADVVKGHPASLFYYICDELPAKEYRQIEARRAQLNRRDPDHPTMAAYFQYPDLPYYSSCQDIMGQIYYPISGPSSASMELIETNLQAASKYLKKSNGTMSVWAIGQAFNWGSGEKDRGKYEREYRYPTEHEYIAMTLLSAIHGVRGYLFYSYHPLRYVKGCMTAEEKEREFRREWPKLCGMARNLQALEPYLLSLKRGPEVRIASDAGKIRARAFVLEQGDSMRVLIAALGPGKADGIITVAGRGDLRSKYGKTISLGNGRYRFTGQDICCDILE